MWYSVRKLKKLDKIIYVFRGAKKMEERLLIEKYHKELQRLIKELNQTKRDLANAKDLNKILIKYIFDKEGGVKDDSNGNSINNNTSSIKH